MEPARSCENDMPAQQNTTLRLHDVQQNRTS
jgi:hypothetical protein